MRPLALLSPGLSDWPKVSQEALWLSQDFSLRLPGLSPSRQRTTLAVSHLRHRVSLWREAPTCHSFSSLEKS